MAPITTLPIVVQRGSYRLQLSNLKINDDELPQLLQRARNELTNSYSQSQGKRATFGDVPLIEVTFNKNFITDKSSEAIVSFIAQNKNIQSVELLGNGLTDLSAPHIIAMITTLPVQRLKVGDNAFTCKGAAIIGEALKQSHSGFLQLHIGGNPIGDEGVRLLCEACETSKVEVLGLRDVAFAEEGWQSLGSVVASSTAGVHDFQLRGNNLSLVSAQAFAKGIMATAATTSHAFKLTVLSVGNCGIDGPAAQTLFAALDRAHNLTQIDLSNNPFGDDGVAHLVKWLASGHRNHLQWLSLQKAGITADGISAMTRGNRCDTVLAAVKYLDLSLNTLGEDGAPAVATIIQWGMVLEKVNLRRCMLAGPRLSEICSAVNHHPTLKEIDFASNFSGSENAKYWADIILATNKLEHVVLTDNAFTAEDTADIVQALTRGTGRSLSVLQLGGQSHVPPLGNVITPPIITKLNEALSRNRQQANDTRRPTAAIQFDPVRLRQSLGYPGAPMPVPMPGKVRPDCLPFHPQLMQTAYGSTANMPNPLQGSNGNFVCFAPQQPQQPQYFMCTPLAGPAVYGACMTTNHSTPPYTVKLLDPNSPNTSGQISFNPHGGPFANHNQGGYGSAPPPFPQHTNMLPSYASSQMAPPPHYASMHAGVGLPLPAAVPAHLSPPQGFAKQPFAQQPPLADAASLSTSNNSLGHAAAGDGYIGDNLGAIGSASARANPFSSLLSAMPSYGGNAAPQSMGAAYYGIDYII